MTNGKSKTSRTASEWIEEYLARYPAGTAPEDEMARRAVERNVAADRKQIARPGSVA